MLVSRAKMAESESLIFIFLYLCILYSCAYCNENIPRRNILHVANSGNHYSDGSGPRVFELDKDSGGYVNLENDKFYGKMKRSVNIQHNITTKMTQLNDSHHLILVHWIGERNDVIVCLTKNGKRHTTMGRLLPSAVYISYDYGDTFENKTESFALDDKKKSYARLDQFVSHPKYTSHVVFSDLENKFIFTTKDSGRTFQRIQLPFHPSSISFHDYEPFTFLIHDKINSSKQLWLTKDFGQTWRPVQESVKKFYWSGSTLPTPPSEMPNVIPMQGYRYKNHSELLLFVQRMEPSGKSTILSSPSMFQDFNDKTVWISNVHEFELKDDFMFALKSSGQHNVDLFVSYKRGPFVKAVFPSELDRQDYHIPDVSEGQIFVAVSHTDTLANLYTSQSMDDKNIYFALSLERFFCFFPNFTWKDSWLMDATEEPFADFHKVEGLRGIYIASQVQPDADSNNIGPEHLLTLITFDRGGEWRPLSPPPLDASGVPIKCSLNDGCSLHLSQKFSQLYPSTQSIPILSSKSAPGIIMATGTIGKSLKGHPGVFLSRDGGLTWRQILSNYHIFNFGDHGGVLVAVKYYRSHFKSKELLYSTDEGENFLSHEFHAEELRVYGLMVKPGGDTTVFTMFGSVVGLHQWLIIKVDLKNAFSNNCTADDYKFWSPGSRTGHKMPCILGRKETYQRRIPHSNCYSGRDYERPIKIEVCECDAEDFDCDFGFERSITEKHCIRNKSFDFNPYKIPETCTPGGFYNRTRGYRKIPGDVCQNGKEGLYLPQTLPCPLKEKKEFLIVAQRNQISRVDLIDNSVDKLPVSNLTNVVAIEFDIKNNCVYWADIRQEIIGRQCLASGTSKPEILVMQNISSIEGMALDWVSNNLYFVDGTRKKIEVIRTDIKIEGRMRRTILDEKVTKKPRGIAVHPMQGYLFWTDWALNDSCVSRANLDGSNVKKLFANPIVQWPNGITIDYIAERIYWVDAKLDYIASSNLDGKQFKKILQNDEAVQHPFAVAVFKDNMYWDDWKNNCIFIADKDHGVDVQPILQNYSGLMDLKIFAHSFQEGTNQCGDANTNNCSHLCMGSPGGTHICLCPDNMIMEKGVCYCPGKKKPDSNGACPSIDHTCSPDSFMCANTLCIPGTWVCNEQNDCGDNSDEVNCYKKKCPPNHFECPDGQCFPLIWKCDFDADCVDGSDENDCHYQNQTCKSDEFKCNNGRCIRNYLTCDGEDDCYDRSDELNCGKNATAVVCKVDEFKCGNVCVRNNWKCDGEVDCPDAEDEQNCNDTCREWQFQCLDKTCIFATWSCDGSPDCDDQSDELNCTSSAENGTVIPTVSPEQCSDWSFMCQNRHCIPSWWKCDTVDDCGDKSDEMGCPQEETTLSSTVSPPENSESCKAHEFRCYSGECIRDSWVCDGMMDCESGEDEENCKDSITCKPEHFKCRIDGSCIELNQVCDGVSQCPDDSDESDCSLSKHLPNPAGPSCSAGFFSCDASLCIPLSQLCDDHEDCYDSTDENNCNNFTRIYQVLDMEIEQKKSSATSLLIYWKPPRAATKKFQYLPSISEAQKHTKTWHNGSWVDSLEYRFKGLTPYTYYNITVYVRLANTTAVFPPAIYIAGWTSMEVPSPPRNVTVVQKSYKTVEVSWLPPANPNGPIKTYMVQVSPPYPAIAVTVSGSITNTTLELDFSEDQNYKFWVFATNGNYRSDPSKVAVLKFDSSSNVQPIQNLTAEKVDEKSIKLSWKPVTNIDGYRIQTIIPHDARYPNIPTVNASKDASSVVITNLAPVVRYKFEINAYRKNFVGPRASVRYFIDGPALPPITIKSAELVKGEGTSVVLSWSPPQNTTKQKWVYGIYYSIRAEELFQGAKLTTTNLSITVSNLAACEVYLFDVGLVGPYGIGPLAPPLDRTTLYNKNAPPKSLVVKTNPANESEMIVLWEASCEIVVEPIGYELTVTELNLNKSSSITLNPTTKTHFQHTFRSHYGGVYKITVSTTAPEAIPSEPVRYEAPEIFPPHQVQVLSESNGSPVLVWKEKMLPQAIRNSGYKYKVLVSEGKNLNTSTAKEYVTDSSRFIFKDIKEGTMYSFAVMLVTEDGYSSKMSEIKSFQTSELGEFFSSTNFVSILVPIMILSVALLIVLGFFIYRQKRLKRHFSNYANSHYDTRSGSTTFGGADDLDDEESANIRGFSDDEPLVMA